ncbi:hypothetical protein AXF42_Ash011257 [Apostasia shenzhenica]|uniref:Uncharacterized protein n=1 Tax=Apostasia shenzhenica TaxID=1088818 RepID=A0A2I0ALB4_9ASPA|nr:hypothetical protein AXF42_Ash011257 [Apostasia shenzhenica]
MESEKSKTGKNHGKPAAPLHSRSKPAPPAPRKEKSRSVQQGRKLIKFIILKISSTIPFIEEEEEAEVAGQREDAATRGWRAEKLANLLDVGMTGRKWKRPSDGLGAAKQTWHPPGSAKQSRPRLARRS